VLEARVASLARHLDDAISLAWSSDFSEALSRSQFELRSLAGALALETHSGRAEGACAAGAVADRRNVGRTHRGPGGRLALLGVLAFKHFAARGPTRDSRRRGLDEPAHQRILTKAPPYAECIGIAAMLFCRHGYRNR